MGVKKLTLSASEDVIAAAKRIAARNKTSVSALFARLLHAVDDKPDPSDSIGPITRRASGIASLARDRSDTDLLADALEDRYGSRR